MTGAAGQEEVLAATGWQVPTVQQSPRDLAGPLLGLCQGKWQQRLKQVRAPHTHSRTGHGSQGEDTSPASTDRRVTGKARHLASGRGL